MRVIDRSKYRDEEGQISLQNRILGTLQNGLGWYAEMESQAEFTNRLARHLDDEYLLLSNAVLPYSDLTVPMILLGPPGVRTIIPSPIKGIYRAKGDEWFEFNGRTRRFSRARPNVQSLAISYAEALHAFLQGQGVPLPDVEPVLVFTDPRTLVDTAQPAVRVVQADAVDRFAANLQKFQPIMDQEDISSLVDLILNPPQLPEAEPDMAVEPEPPPEPEPAFEGEPAFEPEDREPEFDMDLSEPADRDAIGLEDAPAARSEDGGLLNFSRSQWIVLGLLFLIEIVIVLVFAAIIFTDVLI